jgi:hypothetical protein
LGGFVHLMTAGAREPIERERLYTSEVRRFDWQDFYFNWKGDRFFDWLRRQWSGLGGYDVVLVDSRTGITEMGGICAYQLADAAVLLCAPNYQNLRGTKAIADDFRSDSVRALRYGRLWRFLQYRRGSNPNIRAEKSSSWILNANSAPSAFRGGSLISA